MAAIIWPKALVDKGLPTAALPVVEEAIGVLFADWISAVGLHICLLIFQV